MTSSLSKYASSLILLEWGAIMLYFNLSGRVSAFLHPNFRPLLWLVGVSLALTAVIIAFAHKSECCGADEALSTHDHGRGAHHHGHSHHGDQAHKGLTAASVMSFLVLCVPIALAAVISPDRFGETFLRNRGTIETVRVLPGSEAKAAPQPSAEDNSLSANSNSNALPSLTGNRVDAASTVPASAEPMLPTSDEDPEESTAAEYQNPALRPDKEGNIHAEVIDLLYACEDQDANVESGMFDQMDSDSFREVSNGATAPEAKSDRQIKTNPRRTTSQKVTSVAVRILLLLRTV